MRLVQTSWYFLYLGWAQLCWNSGRPRVGRFASRSCYVSVGNVRLNFGTHGRNVCSVFIVDLLSWVTDLQCLTQYNRLRWNQQNNFNVRWLWETYVGFLIGNVMYSKKNTTVPNFLAFLNENIKSLWAMPTKNILFVFVTLSDL